MQLSFYTKKRTDSQISFSQFLFYSYFKNNVTVLLLIIVILFLCIDALMMSLAKSDLRTVSNDVNQAISKQLDDYFSIAEHLSQNKELIERVQSLEYKSNQEQLYVAYEINKTIEDMFFSSPEISDVKIFTPYISIEGFPSLYPLHSLPQLSVNKVLRKNYSVLFDRYSTSEKIDIINAKEIAIWAPFPLNSTAETSYICLTVSKFFFYTEFLRNTSPNGYILNEDDTIISTSDLALYGQKYAHPINKKNATMMINNNIYITSVSDINKYGWRTVCITPISKVRTWTLMLFAYFCVIIIFMLFFTRRFSHEFSRQLTVPLEHLQNAFDEASSVPLQQCNILEINYLFDKYNKLVESNKHLIDKIKTQQAKQRDTEINALITQINPHFLYNTLTAISWKALDNNCSDICSLISKLGKLCQYNYKFKSYYCKLHEEITSITLYMDLQNECFNNSFEYTFNIDDNVQDLKIPRFILQPIIENSIIHGLSKAITDGKIIISAHMCGNDLIIKVSDNGSGINPDILYKLNTNTYVSDRHGISNVIDRIKLHCGEKYGLTFSSHPFSATTVTVTLPILYFEENQRCIN